MTTTEFSNEFDALVQAYPTIVEFSKQDKVAFDEYEKSIFLTKAQEELVIELYNGKNPFGDSFEKTEEMRRYLGELTKQYITTDKQLGGLSDLSSIFTLPDDLWFITYETVGLSDEELGCNTTRDISVTPVTLDEYFKIRNNPFRGHNKRRALRLDMGGNKVEIISEYNINQYLIRYLSKPSPIILVDLPDELSVNGIKERTECILNPVIHRTILDRAVRLAITSKVRLSGSKE